MHIYTYIYIHALHQSLAQLLAVAAILLFPWHPVAEYIAADLEGFRWSSPIRASTLWTSIVALHCQEQLAAELGTTAKFSQ